MKEWYLTTSKPNICSGFESDAISEYAEDNFTDVLKTTFSDTVLLYNSDLSIESEIKCIVQGNIADTQLKSMERTILFPIDREVKSGQYIFYENSYWLLTGYPGSNKHYKKITASLCSFKLRWQNSSGIIIERWAYSSDFTKYSNGTTRNNTVTIGDNQYGLTLPIDNETKILKRDMRFAIDFDDAIKPDIYSLTNRKVVLNNYQNSNNGGTMVLTMSYDSFSNESDKRVTLKDGLEVWICDYFSSTKSSPTSANEMTDLFATITGNNNLKCGYARTYTVIFTDENDNEMNDTNFTWNVISNFDVTQVVNGNKIQLSINDEGLIGSSFILQILSDDEILTETNITVVAAF